MTTDGGPYRLNTIIFSRQLSGYQTALGTIRI